MLYLQLLAPVAAVLACVPLALWLVQTHIQATWQLRLKGLVTSRRMLVELPELKMLRAELDPPGRPLRISYGLSIIPWFVLATLGATLTLMVVTSPERLWQDLRDAGAESELIVSIAPFAFGWAFIFRMLILLRAALGGRLSSIHYVSAFLNLLIVLALAILVSPALWPVVRSEAALAVAVGALIAVLPALVAVGGLADVVPLPDKLLRDGVAHRPPRLSLFLLSGIDARARSLLASLEISDIQQLATANALRLYVQTGNWLRTIDWIGQAQLFLAFGPVLFRAFQASGLRTSLDLAQRVEGPDAPQRMAMALAEAPDAPSLNPYALIERARLILDDLHFLRLRRLVQAYDGDGPERSRAIEPTPSLQAIEDAVASTIATSLGIPRMISYRGYVAAEVRWPREPRGEASVSVLFFAEAPDDRIAARLEVDGDPADYVPFTIECEPEGNPANIARREAMVPEDTTWEVDMTLPVNPETERIWVQILQRNRVLQVIELDRGQET